tara:strand:- start:1031 stop:1678 length:648 start_codon:yes stop_codon:yes gene_type:complete
MSTTEKSLPEVVEKLLQKKEVSQQQNVIVEARTKLEVYTDSLKEVKVKPADYAQAKRAISLMKKAEKEFVVSEGDIYSSAVAVNASKKVISWIKDNTTEAQNIGMLLEFRDKVEKAAKKKPATAKKENVDKYRADKHDSLIDAILGLIGQEEALTKKELTEKLEGQGHKKDGSLLINDVAVSSYVSAWVAAGKSDKCDKLHEHKGKKYASFREKK